MACNSGLLSVTNGLLWGIVARCVGLLGVPARAAIIITIVVLLQSPLGKPSKRSQQATLPQSTP